MTVITIVRDGLRGLVGAIVQVPAHRIETVLSALCLVLCAWCLVLGAWFCESEPCTTNHES